MEFIDLSRYYSIEGGKIPSFSHLREMKHVLATQDLKIADTPENREHINKLLDQKILVAPVRRLPPDVNYINRPEFPRRILLEMTSKCNAKCRMCPQLELKRPRMDMPTDLYLMCLDEIDKHGVEGIWIYHLGEPLLHQGFKEIVNHLSRKKNLGVKWMSTNGLLFNEDKIKFILKSNIDYINISVHGVTKETYDTVLLKGDFETVQQNLNKYYELKHGGGLPKKPFLHCQMIEQETTKHEVDAFIKNHYNKADIVSINMLEYVNLPNNYFGFQQRKRGELSTCTRVSRNDCFVFSNGDVTLCDAAFNAEICLGNINEQSLYEIWNGQTRKDILKSNSEGKMYTIEFCRHCTDYDI